MLLRAGEMVNEVGWIGARSRLAGDPIFGTALAIPRNTMAADRTPAGDIIPAIAIRAIRILVAIPVIMGTASIMAIIKAQDTARALGILNTTVEDRARTGDIIPAIAIRVMRASAGMAAIGAIASGTAMASGIVPTTAGDLTPAGAIISTPVIPTSVDTGGMVSALGAATSATLPTTAIMAGGTAAVIRAGTAGAVSTGTIPILGSAAGAAGKRTVGR